RYAPLSHTHPPRYDGFRDYPRPFHSRVDCAWNCWDGSAADRRVSRSFGAGNNKLLCQGEAQQDDDSSGEVDEEGD
ncbi:unnamed protein product, partial [Ectocarpus sp. 12 AP-2014]